MAGHPAMSADPIIAIAVILVMPKLQTIIAPVLPFRVGRVWRKGKRFMVFSHWDMVSVSYGVANVHGF